MSFGGAVGAMITSLKNNSRSRKSTFDKIESYDSNNNITLEFKNKATPEELENIREKLQLENRKKNIRLGVYIAIFFIVLLLFFALT